MLGLIKKDLLMIKSNLKIIAIILVVFAIMYLQGEDNLSFVPAMLSIIIFLSTFSYDEFNKFNAYAISFPNGRKNIVKSKFISSLILIFVSIIITMIASIGLGYFKDTLDLKYIIGISIGCAFACILIQSITFPLIFKFGVEKARIGLFIGAFGFSSIVLLIAKVNKFKLPSTILSFLESNLLLILIVIALLLLLGSYFISQKIYSKKEF